ncbi:hypothetical protein FIBSPDRAFT_937836, partial [Athelia psychrophila]
MANIIAYAPSIVICTGPVVVTGRRKAAVGRHPASRAHWVARGHRGGALLEPARQRDRRDAALHSYGGRLPRCDDVHRARHVNALHARLRPVLPARRADEHTGVRAHEVWHAAATAISLVLVAYIVLGVLNE